jgi:hypothetical protein
MYLPNNYYLYTLGHGGITQAEQRAADDRMGELAAALDGLRAGAARAVSRWLGTLAQATRRWSREQALLPMPGPAPRCR